MTLRQAEGPPPSVRPPDAGDGDGNGAGGGGADAGTHGTGEGGFPGRRLRYWAIIVVILAEVLTGLVAVAASRDGGGERPASGSEPASSPTSAVPAADARAVISPHGVVVPVVAPKGHGWTVTTPCGQTATLDSGRPLTSVDVVLDPGHSGTDIGVKGPNGLTEASLNLAVATEAEAALRAAGLSVVLTHPADYDMQLTTRAQLAVALHPRAFVSIHHNSGAVVHSARPGTDVFYQGASVDSRRLGGLVYEEVTKALSAYPVAWVTTAGAGARVIPGTSGDYYGLLRETPGITSVLGEMAYLTNRPEADLLARPDVQRAEGQAVARGIIRFLSSPDPGSGFTPPGVPPRGHSGQLICRDPPL